MTSLSLDAQQAVLDCPHPTHDSVRLFLRGKPYLPPWLTIGP